MRTRFLSKCTNQEVEAYLEKNDLIFIPVGVTELHGGLPLDSETVISEAVALRLAEKTDGLVLHNLPYFYAGATISGRGTVQVSVRDGIDYLLAVAKSLYRQGFKRQVFISLHGPASLTIGPVIRDFFEEKKVPLLYIDSMVTMMKPEFAQKFFGGDGDPFTDLILAGYDYLGRLDEVPLTTPENDFSEKKEPSVAFANDLFRSAFGSSSTAYYFGELSDHMPTHKIESEAHRQQIADNGKPLFDAFVESLEIEKKVALLKELADFQDDVVIPKYKDWLYE